MNHILKFQIGIGLIVCLSSCQQKTESKEEVCNCDSIVTKNNQVRCYLKDSYVSISKNTMGDTIEVKKFYFNKTKYRKTEYILFVNNKIDITKSSFFELSKSDGKIRIKVNSNHPAEHVELISINDTLKFSGNELDVELSSIKSLKEILEFTDKKIENDSVDHITFISRYNYDYNHIVNEKSFLSLIDDLIKCGLLPHDIKIGDDKE